MVDTENSRVVSYATDFLSCTMIHAIFCELPRQAAIEISKEMYTTQIEI